MLKRNFPEVAQASALDNSAALAFSRVVLTKQSFGDKLKVLSKPKGFEDKRITWLEPGNEGNSKGI